MDRRAISQWTCTVACALTLAATPRPADAGFYTVTDLGSLGGAIGLTAAVNNSGQVTGYSHTENLFPYPQHPFLSTPGGGALRDLGSFGGIYSFGYGVNNSGQVAGYSSLAGDATYHAFLSGPNGGPLKDLGTLNGASNSYAYGVNDSGQVAGFSNGHAFLSAPNGGTLKDLGTIGNLFSEGYAVNNSGQVAGYFATPNGEGHAFLSAPNGGPLKDLGTLGGTGSEGYAVNASGQVTGTSTTGHGQHAFLSAPNGGPLKDLGDLGGGLGQGNSINDLGQVVGFSLLASSLTDPHAFLYDGTSMIDLNTLIDPGLGVVLEQATGISNNGYIAAYGTINGQSHAFLLTPATVPEPTSVLMLGLGMAIAGLAARYRSGRPARG